MVGQQKLEKVTRFTDLGSILASDGNVKCDVTCRIAKAGRFSNGSGNLVN